VLIVFAKSALAEDGIAVQRLSLVQFNELIQTENRCFLVAFLAAWCAPCIEELPDLVDIDTRFQNQGLNVIGISVDFDGPRAILPLLVEKKVSFPVHWVGNDVTESYGITGIPLILLVRDGKVVDQIKGKRNKKFLNHAAEAFVGDCLSKKPALNEIQIID
jgi:thiol-disulfide isomerase/thioredoxin